MPLYSPCKISSFLSLIFALLLSITTTTIPRSTYAANILAVFPSVWKSHYLYGRSILQELVANQHHNVTLISAFKSVVSREENNTPTELPHNNSRCRSSFNEIQINGIEQNWLEMGLSTQIDSMNEKSIMERFTRMVYAGVSAADLVLGSKEVKKLLASNESFDLLIADIFMGDALLG